MTCCSPHQPATAQLAALQEELNAAKEEEARHADELDNFTARVSGKSLEYAQQVQRRPAARGTVTKDS